jgi:hypothetical protein
MPGTYLFDPKVDGRGIVEIFARVTGANGADLTISEGAGPIVSGVRTGEGAYTITFRDGYAALLYGGASLMANTPADLAGHTFVVDYDSYDAAAKTVAVVLYSATFAADDLLVNEFLGLHFTFRNTSVAL